MQIFLHVEKGPHIGRRVAIRSGQVASFGKTEQSDHCFEQDLELADQHFRIKVNDMCTLEAIDGDSELLVNGEAFVDPTLSNGDMISAGVSVFRVEIEGTMKMEALPDADSSELNSQPPVAPVDFAQLCVDLDLSEEASAEASSHTSVEEFLTGLITKKLFNDAIRLHVHLLSPANAIAWAAASVQTLLNDDLKPVDLDAIRQASEWADKPSEVIRRECGKKAEELDYDGVGGTLALAAFLSGGNIAPEDFEEEVQPEPFSFGQATAGAVMLAAANIEPDDTEEMMSAILNSAS